MGCTSAIVFTCFGAAYGTAKSGVGISAMGVLRPDLIVKSAYIPIFPSTIRYNKGLTISRHRPSHHGWYHRYLRPRGVCPDLRQPHTKAPTLHGLHTAGSRT